MVLLFQKRFGRKSQSLTVGVKPLDKHFILWFFSFIRRAEDKEQQLIKSGVTLKEGSIPQAGTKVGTNTSFSNAQP